MDKVKVLHLLGETTRQFRKGAVVTETKTVGLRKYDIYMMPHESEAPDELTMVDVHFFQVGVDLKKALPRREELVQLLAADFSAQLVTDEINYMTMGALLGSQELAFHLFALGNVLGIWQLLTPERMGMPPDMCELLAGRGLISIIGWNASATEPAKCACCERDMPGDRHVEEAPC